MEGPRCGARLESTKARDRAAIVAPGVMERPRKPGHRVSPRRKGTRHAECFVRSRSRSAWGRDRRAVRSPRRRDRAPARSHPRVRRPRRLEQWGSLVCRLAKRAHRARYGCGWGARPGCACSRHTATAAEALARGELSYAKVRALTRVATPETEERLLAVGRADTADHVERIVRGWRRLDRKAAAHDDTRRHISRALHVYQDEDGTVVIRGRLTSEAGGGGVEVSRQLGDLVAESI